FVFVDAGQLERLQFARDVVARLGVGAGEVDLTQGVVDGPVQQQFALDGGDLGEDLFRGAAKGGIGVQALHGVGAALGEADFDLNVVVGAQRVVDRPLAGDRGQRLEDRLRV